MQKYPAEKSERGFFPVILCFPELASNKICLTSLPAHSAPLPLLWPLLPTGRVAGQGQGSVPPAAVLIVCSGHSRISALSRPARDKLKGSWGREGWELGSGKASRAENGGRGRKWGRLAMSPGKVSCWLKTIQKYCPSSPCQRIQGFANFGMMRYM